MAYTDDVDFQIAAIVGGCLTARAVMQVTA
jgi:hypothetical protein